MNENTLPETTECKWCGLYHDPLESRCSNPEAPRPLGINKGLNGWALIRQERERQVLGEGYDETHDDKHDNGEIIEAALCYGAVASAQTRGSDVEEWPVSMFDGMNDSLLQWPWDDEWYKPTSDPVRNLAKAGALIAAEIDRIQRARQTPPVIGSGKKLV